MMKCYWRPIFFLIIFFSSCQDAKEKDYPSAFSANENTIVERKPGGLPSEDKISTDKLDSLKMLGLIEGEIISYSKISDGMIEVMTADDESRVHGYSYIIEVDEDGKVNVVSRSSWDS